MKTEKKGKDCELLTSSSLQTNNNLIGNATFTSEGQPPPRLVTKDGRSNLFATHIAKRRRHYAVDVVTTLVEMSAWYNVVMFFFAFFITWILFGLLWWAISTGHGDQLNDGGPNTTMKCLESVGDFTNALIFSVETQTTIGYGTRVMNPWCSETLFFLMVQLLIGVFVESLVTGLIFAKVSRSSNRRRAVRFSTKAVVCRSSDDGGSALMFRVWNSQTSPLIGATLRAVLVDTVADNGGKDGHWRRTTLRLETESGDRCDDDVFFLPMWPITVVHRLDVGSPLCERLASVSSLRREFFEIVVVLEGTVESTGNTTQYLTSYISASEILLNHRLGELQLLCGVSSRWCDISGGKFDEMETMKLDCSNFDVVQQIQEDDLSR